MKAFLHLHVRIQRWVLWWMIFGIICGIVAITNILEHNLSHAQEKILIGLGISNWLLGGLVCYAFEGISIGESAPPPGKPRAKRESKALPRQEQEWHSASDFLLPGNRKSILPPRYR